MPFSRSTARSTNCGAIEYTDWVRIAFRIAPGIKVRGLCKFLLLEAGPEFGLYVTPINIDPENPVMPISSPSVYSVYLTKQQGPFFTLGLAEDTWAVNEHVLNDKNFLQQCLDADREREVMFFDSLDKVSRGLCVVVFDGPDRLQHMFWRDIDPSHPARAQHPVPEGRNAIEDLYKSMDDLVGRTMARCPREDNLLFVISDHGFNTFRRGLDLNRWLEEKGYLVLHPGRRNEEFLAGVDWSRTKAFALGLSGIFLNLKGRNAHGIVIPGKEADELCEEIAGSLTTLIDPQDGASAVKKTYVTSKVYRGPYKDNAPDLIPGYHAAIAYRGKLPSAERPSRCFTTIPKPGAATIASTRRSFQGYSSAIAPSKLKMPVSWTSHPPY